MLIAEYCNGSKKTGPFMTVSDLTNGQKLGQTTVNVKDKREARKLALAQGAKPWNF